MMTPETRQRIERWIKSIEATGPACRIDPKTDAQALRDLLAAAEAGAQWKRERAELEGLRKLVAGEQIGVSTGIREETTYGYGQLDNNGYWEFPVSEVAAAFVRSRRDDKAELARLRPLAEAGERLKEHVLATIGRLEHELLTPDDIWSDHVQEAVRWLQEGVQAGSTCRVCGRSERQHAKSNPPEVTRDHAFLALLPAEAPVYPRMHDTSATYAPVDPEDVADALGAVPAETPAPSEKKEREIVMRWLQRRYEHYQAIQAANPWTSGNDGVHDDAEQRADALGHELALLEAEAPAPTKEE